MQTNLACPPGPVTHEAGAAIQPRSPEAALRRSILSCLLWEDEFYEDGETIAGRLVVLARAVAPSVLAALAVEARARHHLRHAPLLLVRELARHPDPAARRLVAGTLAEVIQRADELAEFVALYWREKRQPLTKQVKRGLARAFAKFGAYQLAKYDRARKVRLRDVLCLCHPKPADEAQAALWKSVLDGTLPTPDTWETALSAGADKRATFERLLREGKLGDLALLRNLRNMADAGVDAALVREALARATWDRVLPFRFLAAARAVPTLEPELDAAMLRAIGTDRPLRGHTVVLVDVSGSMDARLSARSDLTRLDAACGVAAILRESCELVTIASFSSGLAGIPGRHGMALRDAIVHSQPHGSTLLGKAVAAVPAFAPDLERLVVVTDEQSADAVGAPPARRGYMLNVASARNGVGFGPWIRVDGFSEAVVKWIAAHEAEPTP